MSSSSSAAAAPAVAGGSREVFDVKLRESVVCVLMKPKKGDGLESIGSGFIIRSSRGKCIVMTCYHVLADFKEKEHTIRVRMCGTDVELPAKIMGSDPVADLLILRVPITAGKEYKALEFGNSSDVPLNDPVFLVAYISPPPKVDADSSSSSSGAPTAKWVIPKLPGASPGNTAGPILHNGSDWNEEIQFTCRSKPGLSGGPVLWQGKVVGVHKTKNIKICLAAATATVNTVMHRWLGAPLDDEEADKRMTTEEAIRRLPL